MRAKLVHRSIFIIFSFRRNVRDQFAWRMDSNRVSAFPDRANQKPNHVNCVAKYPAKIIHAKARSTGTKRLMMFPTCSLNPERLAMNTLAIAMFSRSVEKLIHPGRWQRSENFSCPKKALRRSRNGSSAIGMQSV